MLYEIYNLNINNFSKLKWKSKCKQISWKTKRMFLTVHVENPSIFSTVSRVNAPPPLNGKNHCECICALGFDSVSVYWYIWCLYLLTHIWWTHSHTFVIRSSYSPSNPLFPANCAIRVHWHEFVFVALPHVFYAMACAIYSTTIHTSI